MATTAAEHVLHIFLQGRKRMNNKMPKTMQLSDRLPNPKTTKLLKNVSEMFSNSSDDFVRGGQPVRLDRVGCVC